jgi:hypothetical protein
MKSKITHLKVIATLLTLLITASSCKKSPVSADADKERASADDTISDEILASPDIMEARDWLARYPKSMFSQNALDPEDFNGTPLSPVVARLSDAGATRIVINYGTLGKGHVLIGVVVVLPTDPSARQKVFTIGSELSQIEGTGALNDYGQKYLYFNPD